MNILILNASPKSKGSASAFYSSLLRLFLTGCEVKVNPLRGARDYEKIFGLLPWADAVVISAPVYVDAAPSHVTAFLEQAEQICQEKPCHFKLYAISNCGFIEGHQNELHLRIYEAWCQRADVCWGGGVGIGGGVTLVMSLGAVICLVIMGHRIKHGACHRNLFTRCLMPSFLFIPVSDIFMLLSALAHGNLPYTLFRRCECPAREKGTHL